jgi:hypothetical protein
MFGVPLAAFVPVTTFSPNAQSSRLSGHDSEISRIAAEMAEAAKKREARAALDASRARMKKSWAGWLKGERKVHETVG